MIHERNRVALAWLIDPLEAVSARWGNALTDSARNMLLMEVGRRSLAYWAWDEQTWTAFVASVTGEIRHRRRAHLVAWGYLFGGHRRLHHRVQMPKLRPLATSSSATGPSIPRWSRSARCWNAGRPRRNRSRSWSVPPCSMPCSASAART
ncbi:hypothetical protein GCM10010251_94060 [Streptomyces aurantiogriseus]|uniref:Uncharacterized protein n=1 Tax=Streptomyces aurantiogriseus TaxID=66870 RepID=A0A918FP28_9ACTN|nr:hypothetical protein GCM10010251_94060 [Streptomyces aurantiogriseus]